MVKFLLSRSGGDLNLGNQSGGGQHLFKSTWVWSKVGKPNQRRHIPTRKIPKLTCWKKFFDKSIHKISRSWPNEKKTLSSQHGRTFLSNNQWITVVWVHHRQFAFCYSLLTSLIPTCVGNQGSRNLEGDVPMFPGRLFCIFSRSSFVWADRDYTNYFLYKTEAIVNLTQWIFVLERVRRSSVDFTNPRKHFIG